MVLNKTIRFGSRLLSKAEVTKTGKYGIGINGIILPIKLIKNIPM